MRNIEKRLPKLHVLLTKEEVSTYKIDAETVIVVFDVLLATTTIATVLHNGAKQVLPVMNAEEALLIAEKLSESNTILTGESGGRTIDGFIDPLPTVLKTSVANKTVVLSTTNGTVAIRSVSKANTIYAASLVNADAVAEKISTSHTNAEILLVCAGSMGQFAMEDFYGAGSLLDRLIQNNHSWELTDAANAALLFYRGNQTDAHQVLKASSTGKMMLEMELANDVQFASEEGIIPIVPQYQNGKMIVKG